MNLSKRLFYIFSLLLLSLTILRAQEQGEILYFNKTPNLDFVVTDDLLETLTDSALFQSPISAKSHNPISRVLFNGALSDTNMALQISYQGSNNNWSQWQDAYTKIFSNGRFWARFDLKRGSTYRIKCRFLNKGIKPPARIEIYAVEGIDLKLQNQRIEKPSNKAPEKIEFSLIDTIPKPPLITRQQWGANPPIGNYVPHNPYRLTQHHTAGTRVSTLAQGIAEMQFIQNFHQNGRGWQDIGYHFCVDDSGRIYEGVPPDFRGTHVGGNNTGNVGISYLGNFHISGEFPTPAALLSLVQIWSWLSFEYGVNPDSLFGHRDYNNTACPGDNLYPHLPDLRNRIRQMLGFGAPYAANPFPQPFSNEVPPNTPIQVFIKDEVEGVDINSIVMSVNGDAIVPVITGAQNEYQVFYQPAIPFPSSQTVVIEVEAADLALPPNIMQYTFQFKIEVQALHVEVASQSTLVNGMLEISGVWQVDPDDVILNGLTNGVRLLAADNDGSHRARIFPNTPEDGDYHILIASSDKVLGKNARYRLVSEDGYIHPHFAEYNGVYFNQWGLLGPTPVHFEADSDSLGYIEISGLNGIETQLMIDAFRLELVDKLDPPVSPTLKWVRFTDPVTNETEVAWYPSLEGDIAGYRLFTSDDGLTWGNPLVDENVLGPDAHFYVLPHSGGSTVYYRVVAVDTNKFINELGEEEPFVSSPSDAYGVGINAAAHILIVDNFDRQASWHLPYHPFVASHGEALDAQGYGFESCTETAVQNGDINLNDYEIVIYFCGDDSRSDESLAAADQFRLLNYLESGGKLFISGSEIGYDFAATTPLELARYENLLKAKYIGDLSGSNRVLGENGTVFAGLDFIYGTMTGPNLYLEDYPDFLQPLGGSQVALFYDNLRIAGVQYTGTYNASSLVAQMVYLGFTFETIVTPGDRAALMGRVLDYFGFPTAIDGDLPNTPERFRLSQNYPNPFNPSTTIRYFIPASKNNAAVQLEIFNTLGQKVRTLVNGKRTAGSYEQRWDGKNESGLPVASGVYIYRLKAGDLTAAKKLVLIR